jgi:hypothetical protein
MSIQALALFSWLMPRQVDGTGEITAMSGMSVGHGAYMFPRQAAAQGASERFKLTRDGLKQIV